MIDLLGSIIVFLVFSLVDVISFLIGFLIIHLVIVVARLLIPKKRKKPVFKTDIFIIDYIQKSSTISAHTARASFIVSYFAFNYNYYLFFLMVIPLLVGYFRIRKKHHDLIDVLFGLVLGVYATLVTSYLF